jgi:hypothetical protein
MRELVMVEWVSFYDDFMAFQGRCAFFCDASSALASQQQWETASQRGLQLHSSQLKDELERLRERLHQLVEEASRQAE